MKLSRLTLGLAVFAALMLFASGSGTRFGLWPFTFGFQLLKWAAWLGVAAALVALVGLLVPRLRAAGGALLAVAMVLGAGVALVPAYWIQAARAVPPIHDISTDLQDPPAFAAVLARRGADANPAEHGGEALAAAQRSAYPDVRPLMLDVAQEKAFARALRAAREMHWEIVAQDAASGRIEATATTFWFGFKDDVVVRVVPSGRGSRIDVRSLSRVGVSDVGANARRIRDYLARLQE